MKRLAILILLPLCTNAYAWGILGHKIVAQFAQDQLTSEAKKEMAALIPGQSLADVSTWADQVRNTTSYKYTSSWHFADVADGETYDHSEHNPSGDVVVAIQQQIEVLKSKESLAPKRVEALKFIVHFVGDIHQPLHVGRPDDRGGNQISVKYQGRSTNLHSLWDSSFIEEQRMSIAQYAAGLEKDLDANDEQLRNTPLNDIIKEDMAYRDEIYRFSGNTIDEKYAQRARAIVDRRLKLGGQRLAAILNAALN